jgi:hypothetical protein
MRKLVVFNRPRLTSVSCAPSFMTASFLAVILASHASAGTVPPQPKMGEPVDGLSLAELDRFEKGREQFTRVLQIEDGLGPTHNQLSCGSCHNNPVGGSGGSFVTRFGMIGKKGEFDPMDAFGGSLLQALTITPGCGEVLPPDVITAHRITPSALGFGLVEAIPDGDIQANADSPPRGVSGRTHIVQPLEDLMGPTRVGRFGWKAQVATVLSFSGDASLNEMGLTNYLVPTENAPNGDTDLLAQCDTVADPEDVMDGEGFFFIERVTDFQRFLAPPPQTPRSGMTGEQWFDQVGCNKCHVSTFTTGNAVGLEPFLVSQAIQPYSDFLLHDMGQAGDFIGQGQAAPTELRTAPLWGLRVRDPMWHDGRFAGGTFAERVAAAIAQHNAMGSEANKIVVAYNRLSPGEKAQIVAFLDSLGRAEFDGDGNNEINVNDFYSFLGCYGTAPITPDDPCAIHDIDQDGDVDDDDYASFLLAYDDALLDCDDDRVLDLTEILLGAPDIDMNGVPDDCPAPCPGDFVSNVNFQPPGDGNVDAADLAFLLGEWGPNPGSPADIVSNVTFQPPPDGNVDAADLAFLLGEWGACGP